MANSKKQSVQSLFDHPKAWSVVSLMFSAFYFFPFLFVPLSTSFVLISLLMYLVFVGLYFKLIDCPKNHVLPYVAAMTILATLGSSHYSSSSVFFCYAAFFTGFYQTKLHTLFVTIAICISLFLAATLFDLWKSYYIFPGLLPTIAMAFMGLFIQASEKFKNRELQSAEDRRQLAKVAERERIARDLHDTLGHTLSSIALKAQLAKKLGDRNEISKALQEIDEVAKLASETLSDVRQAISGYKSKGLNAQLAVLQSRLESAGYTVGINQALATPDAQREAALILMITEAVTNIIRHSNGDKVKISLMDYEHTIEASISDNGNSTRYLPGNGLSGIRERLEPFNGELVISTENGFHLHIKVPTFNEH